MEIEMNKPTDIVFVNVAETSTIKKEVEDIKFRIKVEGSLVKSEPYENQSCPDLLSSSNLEQQSALFNDYPEETEALQCDVCKYQTRHKDSFKSHILTHDTTGGTTPCKTESNFNEHSSLPKSEPCSSTVCKSENLADETNHQSHAELEQNGQNSPKIQETSPSESSQSKQKMYSCELCKYKSKRKSRVKQHMLCHKDASEVPIYKCENCMYETKYKHDIAKHQLVHKDPSEVTMYRCDVCSYQTKYKKHLRRHAIIHDTSSEMYKCSECFYETKRKECISRHQLGHRNREMRELMRIKNPKRYVCNTCGYVTNRKDSLRQHGIIHKSADEIAIHRCQMCSFQTKYKENLTRHMLRHKCNVDPPVYTCPTCSYETKREAFYATHMSLHELPEGARLFKCDICPYVTKYKANLKNHIPTHNA